MIAHHPPMPPPSSRPGSDRRSVVLPILTEHVVPSLKLSKPLPAQGCRCIFVVGPSRQCTPLARHSLPRASPICLPSSTSKEAARPVPQGKHAEAAPYVPEYQCFNWGLARVLTCCSPHSIGTIRYLPVQQTRRPSQCQEYAPSLVGFPADG